MITNYKDYMRLHKVTWIIMDYIDYFNHDHPAFCGIIMIKRIFIINNNPCNLIQYHVNFKICNHFS